MVEGKTCGHNINLQDPNINILYDAKSQLGPIPKIYKSQHLMHKAKITFPSDCSNATDGTHSLIYEYSQLMSTICPNRKVQYYVGLQSMQRAKILHSLLIIAISNRNGYTDLKSQFIIVLPCLFYNGSQFDDGTERVFVWVINTGLQIRTNVSST